MNARKMKAVTWRRLILTCDNRMLDICQTEQIAEHLQPLTCTAVPTILLAELHSFTAAILLRRDGRGKKRGVGPRKPHTRGFYFNSHLGLHYWTWAAILDSTPAYLSACRTEHACNQMIESAEEGELLFCVGT